MIFGLILRGKHGYFIRICIILILTCLGVVGCGNSNETSPKTPTHALAPSTEPAVPTNVPTNIPTNAPTNGPTSEPTQVPVTPTATITPTPDLHVPGVTYLEINKTPDPSFEVIKKQNEATRNRIEEQLLILAQGRTLPCINITTSASRKIMSKDEYVPSVIDVFNCEEEHQLTAFGGVKVRGNSTADTEEEGKPYRIKFEKKQAMLGLHDGKKYKSWVLLKTYWNLIPDYTAFRLASAIFQDKYYVSDCRLVNVFVNGKNLGLYVLCEQNQAGKGRVDIYEPELDELGTDIGYLLELDNYPSDEHPYFAIDYRKIKMTDAVGKEQDLGYRNYSIKSEINTPEQLEYIRKYVCDAFEILYEASVNNKAYRIESHGVLIPAFDMYTPEEAVEAVFDLDSLVNMLILEEICQNYDVGGGSFYFCVDFSEKSMYPKLTFMAPWDFNWAYYEEPDNGFFAGTFQKAQAGYDRSNPWLVLCYNAPWFRERVSKKWANLMETGVMTQTIEAIREELPTYKNDLGDEAWKADSALNVLDFVTRRIEWLDENW